MECPTCGGPLEELGGLGNLIWYRCRNCGMECSMTPEEADDGSVADSVPG